MQHFAPVLAIAATILVVPVAAPAQDFPLTIETKFGTTIIPEQPERVATIDYAGVDNVLALGFQPLTAREWFGPYPDSIWPWAQDLATTDPVVVGVELDFEAIAATDPDVILALRSGIAQDDYNALTRIAPVVAVPPGAGDYGLDWQAQAELTGLALGRSHEAAEQIEQVKASIDAAAQAHPEWQGKTFAMMTYWEGTVGLYSVTDSSAALISQLGLEPHPKVVELSRPGEFYIEISEEILPQIDADVIFWFAPADSPEIAGLVARDVMRAPAEGREIFLSQRSHTNGALSYASLLSLPEAVDRLTPMIEAAIDGDPATEVPID